MREKFVYRNGQTGVTMAKDTQALMDATARRLRAIMQDLELETVDDLAVLVSAARSRVSNWLNAYHLPPVKYMIRICEKTNLSLDWIYRGRSDGLSYAAVIRLTALEQGMQVVDAAPEPEPEPEPPPVPKAPQRAKTEREPGSRKSAAVPEPVGVKKGPPGGGKRGRSP